jgi:hypothetical protein
VKMLVNTPIKLEWALSEIKRAYDRWGAVETDIRCGVERSRDQNALSHVWYVQISEELGEQTPEGVKAECKLNFGLPLMRSDESWNEIGVMLDKIPYEKRLAYMRHVALTSEMTVKQMTEYMAAVQRHYAERGVTLE